MKQLSEMSVFEQSRWCALLDAVDVISDACKTQKADFDNIKISPLDVVKYINSISDGYARRIIEERNKVLNNTTTQYIMNPAEAVEV